jgi:hypothetical protein
VSDILGLPIPVSDYEVRAESITGATVHFLESQRSLWLNITLLKITGPLKKQTPSMVLEGVSRTTSGDYNKYKYNLASPVGKQRAIVSVDIQVS